MVYILLIFFNLLYMINYVSGIQLFFFFIVMVRVLFFIFLIVEFKERKKFIQLVFFWFRKKLDRKEFRYLYIVFVFVVKFFGCF